MVFLFRSKSIINIFFLALLSIFVHFHFFIHTPLVVTNINDGVFSFLIKKYLTGLPQAPLFILYHLIILIQAIRLNMVMNDFRMYQNSNYTSAMGYVLLSGLLTQWCSISSALIANFLLIWLFIKLCRLYNNPSPKTLLFNTGLIVGLAVVCYHPTAILILVVLFALAVVRPFNFSEWVVLLMGILIPYYFLASWLFLNDQIATFSIYLPFLQWNLPLSKWSPSLVVSLSVLVIVLLAGLYYWQVANSRMVIQIRKNWGVMMVMLFILIPIPFIFEKAGIESAFMSLVPLGAFAGNVFSFPKRLLFPNFLFWLSVLVIVYNNWWFINN